MYGWIGKILRINLSQETIKEENVENATLKKFFGGRGLGAKFLLDDLPPKTDPLGSENEVIFITGPLTGAPVAGTTRSVILGKSPLTGIYGESNNSGSFGPEIKKCGYDAIIIKGAAKKPVFITVSEKGIEIKDASKIWGKTTGEAHNYISKELGSKKVHTASIGKGGENLVPYACIVSDLFHVSGRSGLGAIMGSKNLKAIGLLGSSEVKIADIDKFKELSKRVSLEVSIKGESHRKFGTAETIGVFNITGRLPTKGYREGIFEGADEISGETMAETIMIRKDACHVCPIACNRIVKSNQLYEVDPAYGGPEYETIAAFGSLCMNRSLEAICKANELCNKYGLDTISTGHSIAFAMECFEKNLFSNKEIDNLDLTWGNHKTIIELIEQIAEKRGLGKLLSKGVRAASKEIKGSNAFALHIKGLEMPFHDPRIKAGMGLSFATSNRGACHLQSFSDSEFEKEERLIPELGMNKTVHRNDIGPLKCKYIAISQDLNALYDSSIVCKWTVFPFGYSLNTLQSLIATVTGFEYSLIELSKIGERAFNLGRLFNTREGLTEKDDTIPARFGNQLEGSNPNKGIFSQNMLDSMKKHYYKSRGWEVETGIPSIKKLKELELENYSSCIN